MSCRLHEDVKVSW